MSDRLDTAKVPSLMKAIGECPLSTTIPPLPVSGISFRSEEITEVCTSNNRIDKTGVRARRFALLRSHPVLHGRRALRSRRFAGPPDQLRFRQAFLELVDGLRTFRDTVSLPVSRARMVGAAGAIFPLCGMCHFRAAIPHNSARFDMRTPHRTLVTCLTLASANFEGVNSPARRERCGTGR